LRRLLLAFDHLAAADAALLAARSATEAAAACLGVGGEASALGGERRRSGLDSEAGCCCSWRRMPATGGL